MHLVTAQEVGGSTPSEFTKLEFTVFLIEDGGEACPDVLRIGGEISGTPSEFTRHPPVGGCLFY